MLTTSQKVAYDKFISFLTDEEACLVIYGSAGTGKSFLTKKIADELLRKNINMVGVAPTHKALKVLKKILNAQRIFTIETCTVASLLSKVRENRILVHIAIQKLTL